MVEIALMTVFPFLAVYTAVIDFLTLRIPNWISVVGFFLFFVMAVAVFLSPWIVMWSLLACVATLIVGIVLFGCGVVGGGDVKFAAMAVLWIGWDKALLFYLLSAVYGGLIAIVTIYLSQHLRLCPSLKIGFLETPDTPSGIPYGMALGIAALQLYLDSPIITFSVNVLF